MTNVMWMVVTLALLLLVVAVAQRGVRQGTAHTEQARARRPLTPREQEMFLRLSQAFPQPRFVVLSQVAFTALLTARRQSTRNGFNRKVADFVLCDGSFSVIAAIEIDDRTHVGREDKDAARDAWLTGAGYKVHRYKTIPDVATLRGDLLAAPETSA